MATIKDEIRRLFRDGSIVMQLIGINVVLYVLFALLRVVLLLFNVTDSPWLDLLALPASLPELLVSPWTLITYMFMHANVWHLLFNMLWLYWFGKLALYFFSARHVRGLYLVGGLAGGVLFVVCYNLFPLFTTSVGGAAALDSATLVGASAAILAIVIAAAVREPDYKIRLFLFGTISLKWLAVVTVLIDMLLIASDNAGGHIAHLGGALIGWWFAKGLNRGYDITAWMNRVVDFLGALMHGRLRQPTMKVRQPKAKKTKKSKSKPAAEPTNDHATDYDYNTSRRQQSAEIDRILEKIKQHGYAGLTDDEKKKLFDASQR